MAPQAPPRPRSQKFAIEQIRENLQLIAALSSHNQASGNNSGNTNQRSSSASNSDSGGGLIYVPEGSDWSNVQEVTVKMNPNYVPGHGAKPRHGQNKSLAAGPPTSSSPLSRQQPQVKAPVLGHSPHDSRRATRLPPEPVQHHFSDSDSSPEEGIS